MDRGTAVTPYYEDELTALYHGTWEDVLPSLPKADLIFTSPPYNLAMRKATQPRKWNASLENGYADHDDAMDDGTYDAWQRAFLAAAWDRLTDTGAIFYNHKPRLRPDATLWTPLVVNPSLPVRQIVTWARAGGMNFNSTAYVPTYEWIVVFAKHGWRLRDQSASGVGDLWRIPQESGTLHPAPFPVTLPARAIETAGPRLVIDPHAGSGTTLVAAKRAGVRSIGIEKSEAYCEMAVERLAQGVLAFDS